MTRRVVRAGSLVCLLAVAGSAQAFDETLSFRRASDGTFLAVIDGISDGPGCAPEYQRGATVDIADDVITIASPEDALGCFLPMGPRPYEVIANLGGLADARYAVAWTQPGMDDLAGTLVRAMVGNLVPNPDFDKGLAGWSKLGTDDSAFVLDEQAGVPEAPSLHLPGGGAQSSCLAIDESVPVDFRVLAKPEAGFALAHIQPYSDARCETALEPVIVQGLEAAGYWQSLSLTNVTLPPGTVGVRILLGGSLDGMGTVPDIRYDHVQFGQSGSVPDGIPFAQEGFTGTWYDPSTSGQGFEFVTANEGSVSGVSLFGAWYTYEFAGRPSAQRWYSLQSIEPSPTGPTTFTIFSSTRGNFAAPPETTPEPVGNGTLTFFSCTSGLLTYQFNDGAAGAVPVRRSMPNIECSEDGVQGPPPPSDFGLSGAWYDRDASGQGFMIEVNPAIETTFLGWFTYADSDHLQRWYSGQAAATVGSGQIALTLYASSGGVFDGPGGVTTVPVGTATLTLMTCGMAYFDYAFNAGEMSGRAGSIALTRLSTLASCPLVE